MAHKKLLGIAVVLWAIDVSFVYAEYTSEYDGTFSTITVLNVPLGSAELREVYVISPNKKLKTSTDFINAKNSPICGGTYQGKPRTLNDMYFTMLYVSVSLILFKETGVYNIIFVDGSQNMYLINDVKLVDGSATIDYNQLKKRFKYVSGIGFKPVKG